ncbi:MAG: SDR family NAD(P)-dependent oxidoreductase [Vibrio ordalii]|uniref:SDR family NAD(P)-dependent oxidoreductase n=1 Tax=Vibrio ordalii TaxID=28174 RepID=UPI003F32AEAD
MKNTLKRIVVVGASSAIAEHCLRLWAKNSPDEIIMVGRSLSTLEPIAADIEVRSKAKVRCLSIDMFDSQEINDFAAGVSKDKPVDLVLIAHGSLSAQGKCQNDLELCKSELQINGLSPVIFAEAFAASMDKYNHGQIVIIGSVAGDRGRKSNYVYGASKGLIERYAQGMQHRFASSNVRISLVKPGPTDTPMTAHLKSQGTPLASVEEVAKCIVSGSAKNKTVIYAPAKWRLIMTIIRYLPAFVFNKLDI